MERISRHQSWSSRAAFILAAIGSAVGLGNIWKFPYEAGESGGGAFVLVYLVCVGSVGVPVMITELALGRRGRASPPAAVANVAGDEGRTPAWQGIGWLGVAAALLILSFYSVIGGWTLDYIMVAASGRLTGITPDASNAQFGMLLADETGLMTWHFAFMALTVLIVARGVRGGLEKAVSVMMPLLFVLLLGLAGYALVVGNAGAALAFLFLPDFSKVTAEVVLSALGQAFFSLSLATGAIMTYGAYLPREVSIPRSALLIAGADTAVALVAGLAIFPLVFAYGLNVAAGPSLIFITLPIAFGQMPGGQVVGSAFFLLLAVAALTSSISLLEPAVSWAEERRGVRRWLAAILVGAGVYLFGLITVFSYNRWETVTAFGRNLFDNLTFLTNSIMMPLGGLLMVVFAGWFMRRAATRDELHTIGDGAFALWRATARFVCPLALVLIFLSVTGVI